MSGVLQWAQCGGTGTLAGQPEAALIDQIISCRPNPQLQVAGVAHVDGRLPDSHPSDHMTMDDLLVVTV